MSERYEKGKEGRKEKQERQTDGKKGCVTSQIDGDYYQEYSNDVGQGGRA